MATAKVEPLELQRGGGLTPAGERQPAIVQAHVSRIPRGGIALRCDGAEGRRLVTCAAVGQNVRITIDSRPPADYICSRISSQGLFEFLPAEVKE